MWYTDAELAEMPIVERNAVLDQIAADHAEHEAQQGPHWMLTWS